MFNVYDIMEFQATKLKFDFSTRTVLWMEDFKIGPNFHDYH